MIIHMHARNKQNLQARNGHLLLCARMWQTSKENFSGRMLQRCHFPTVSMKREIHLPLQKVYYIYILLHFAIFASSRWILNNVLSVIFKFQISARLNCNFFCISPSPSQLLETVWNHYEVCTAEIPNCTVIASPKLEGTSWVQYCTSTHWRFGNTQAINLKSYRRQA